MKSSQRGDSLQNHGVRVVSPTKPKRCVFCGDDTVPMTREHIFSDWIADLYGEMPRGISQVVDDEGIKTWSQRAFQDTVRIVCQDRCNGGWMSRLEGRVKPILGPMITKGWATTLSPASQALIAFWAVKTALVLDYFHPTVPWYQSRSIPALYAAQQPLPSHMVWLGRRNASADCLAESIKQEISQIEVPKDDPHIQEQIRADIASGRGIYRITFGIGHVVLQVFGHTLPTRLDISEGPGNGEITHRIWPTQDHVTWPPLKSVDEMGGVRALHGLFGGPPLRTAPPPMLVPSPNRMARRAAERGKKPRP